MQIKKNVKFFTKFNTTSILLGDYSFATYSHFGNNFSPRGEKICFYATSIKLDVIQYAKENSIMAISKKYHVDRHLVSDWVNQKKELLTTSRKKKAKRHLNKKRDCEMEEHKY